MSVAEVPPLFASVVRYAPGDAVVTPFGAGRVLAKCDRKPHVAVQLDMGATLYAKVSPLLRFTMLVSPCLAGVRR